MSEQYRPDQPSIEREDGPTKGEHFLALEGVANIGANELQQEVDLPDGWHRFFANQNFQMMYKKREVTVPGMSLNVPAPDRQQFQGLAGTDQHYDAAPLSVSAPEMRQRAGLYTIFNLDKVRSIQDPNNHFDQVGAMVSVTDSPDGFAKLEASNLPEDAKTAIKQHFQQTSESRT